MQSYVLANQDGSYLGEKRWGSLSRARVFRQDEIGAHLVEPGENWLPLSQVPELWLAKFVVGVADANMLAEDGDLHVLSAQSGLSRGDISLATDFARMLVHVIEERARLGKRQTQATT